MTDPLFHVSRALGCAKVGLIVAAAGGGWVSGRASALGLPWLTLAGTAVALVAAVALFRMADLLIGRSWGRRRDR